MNKFRLRNILIAFGIILALSGRPAPAYAQIPVLDALELGELIEQIGKALYQWWIENFQRAYNTATLYGTQRAAIEANMRAQQANIDMQSRMLNVETTNRIALNHYYSLDNRICPLVSATSAEDEAGEGISELINALNKTVRWIGISGNNPNADIKLFETMCKMNLLDLSPSKKFLAQYCTMTIKGYEGKVMHANSVVGPIEYVFPTNIKKAKDTGSLWLDSPKDVDMPALTAIFYCVLSHPVTARPAASDNRSGATLSEIDQFMDKTKEQLLSDMPGDTCLTAVAERLAMPVTAPTDALKRIHDAQEKFCLQMYQGGCMSEADYTSCKKNGMSALNRQRHLACHMGTPSCVVQGRVARGYGWNSVTKEVLQGQESCNNFTNMLAANRHKFITDMSSAIRKNGNALSPVPTDRPQKQ